MLDKSEADYNFPVHFYMIDNLLPLFDYEEFYDSFINKMDPLLLVLVNFDSSILFLTFSIISGFPTTLLGIILCY